MGLCPSGVLSEWGLVRVGLCPVGLCLSGVLSSGVMSVYQLVLATTICHPLALTPSGISSRPAVTSLRQIRLRHV